MSQSKIVLKTPESLNQESVFSMGGLDSDENRVNQGKQLLEAFRILNGDPNVIVGTSRGAPISLGEISIGPGYTRGDIANAIFYGKELYDDGDFLIKVVGYNGSYVKSRRLTISGDDSIVKKLILLEQRIGVVKTDIAGKSEAFRILNGDPNVIVGTRDGESISLGKISIGPGYTRGDIVNAIFYGKGLDSAGDILTRIATYKGNYFKPRRLTISGDYTIQNYIQNQKKQRDSDDYQDANQAFLRLQEDIQRKQRFFEVLEKEGFSDALTYLNSLEERNQKDREMIAELTSLAFDYRRQKFLGEILIDIDREKPDFDSIFLNLKKFADSPSVKDKQVSGEVAIQVSELETSLFAREILGSVSFEKTRGDIQKMIEIIPKRPQTEGGIDYIAFISELEEEIEEFYDFFTLLQILSRTTELRRNLLSYSPDRVFSEIDAIPSDSKTAILIKNALLEEYKISLESRGKLDVGNIRQEIARRIGIVLDGEYKLLDLGNNKLAKEYMMQNFSQTFFLLFQSLRGNNSIRKNLEKYIVGRDENGALIKNQFLQTLEQLEKQRPLTDIERTYIESIESLTKFNPYIIGLTNEALGITDEFLRNHFDTLSRNTWELLPDGGYIPAVQIGTGPNGLSFFGEIVRYNPMLASQTLVINQGSQPGGPFAIPGGPAWELNSANRRGPRKAILPDAPGYDEKKTVRAYGSPVTRWYPGERRATQDVRQGSINTTVDYLPTPDDLSTLKYPTNEEFQIVLSTQSAMLFRKCVMSTKLEKVSKNKNKSQEGQYEVTLTHTYLDGKQETKVIYTDAVFNAAGLGDDYLGFQLAGSRAEQVIKMTQSNRNFPKISSTLGAFGALANRRGKNITPPRIIAMNGTGNSTDVMIEYLAELFASGNPLVRNIEKIYIIGDGELSKRPRYARINDVKGRNGKGNLIEFIAGRVGDVGFSDDSLRSGNAESKNIAQQPLNIFDANGDLIVDSYGKILTPDAFIGNAGFRSQLDKVYADFLESEESLNIKSSSRPTSPISLPTNSKVVVAESLKMEPNIIFIGTASNPNFDSTAKLSQLPVSAREALLRNGAENAVAVGFRAPDSQASARIFLDQRELDLPTEEQRRKNIVIRDRNSSGNKMVVPFMIDINNISVANNIDSEENMLSSLVAYSFGGVEISDKTDHELLYTIKSTENGLSVSVADENTFSSSGLDEIIFNLVSNRYFQSYAMRGFDKKRRNPKLDIFLIFKKGEFYIRDSGVQIQ